MICYDKMEEINPLSLIIEREVWEKFKKIIPRDKKLNDAVVDLIKKEIKTHKKQTAIDVINDEGFTDEMVKALENKIMEIIEDKLKQEKSKKKS